MPAGPLSPADSLNQISAALGTPNDSTRWATALAAGDHFAALSTLEAPFPLSILLDVSVASCRSAGRADRVRALEAIDTNAVGAKDAILAQACFRT
jgi:hypothetical protein